jgi:hypothetical protein
MVPAVRDLYDLKFCGVITVKDRSLPLRDSYELNGGCPTYCPLLSSLPASTPSDILDAAKWENDQRSLSECILARVFTSLPYANAGSMCAQNMQKASDYADSVGKVLPFRDLCRSLPKGSAGLRSCRALHDDGNSALVPGVWCGVAGNENCILRFLSLDFNVYLRTTHRRFCYFYGWIPHCSEALAGPAMMPRDGLSCHERVHHSSYSKPLIEFIGLSLFKDNESIKSVIDNF